MTITRDNETLLIPADVIAEWLDALDVAEVTKKSYRCGLRALEEYVLENDLDIDELDTADVVAFKKDLLTRLSPGSVSTYLKGVKSFYRWAESDGFPDVASKVKGAPLSRDFKKDTLTREQAKRLLESARGESEQEKRDYAMLSLMLRTGLRDIEVVRADVGDVKPHSGAMVLFVHGKGRSEKDDFVVLAETLQADINRYLAERKNLSPTDPLFTSTSNRNEGGRLTTRSVSGIVKQALRNIGLDSERYTAHSLRHTSVTYALMAGAT
ncbi:MAG: tyrosine-type recombinase/integrase, partial [Eggerthellaceae bacterium]|nr:tyrosine-type recombinase/integrase [Eggerthellaceae bacterium]